MNKSRIGIGEWMYITVLNTYGKILDIDSVGHFYIEYDNKGRWYSGDDLKIPSYKFLTIKLLEEEYD